MDKKAKDGSNLYEYKEEDLKDGFTAAAPILYCDEIEEHFNNVFPERESRVFHEILSDTVHIDVHIMWPHKTNETENFYVLYTTGMSDLPMTLPEGLPSDYERAELMLFLPADWDVEGKENNVFWPISIMKYLARFPHLYKTWFAHGHTIPNGPEYEHFADNTELGGILLLELNEEISVMKMKDGAVVTALMMLPLYQSEMESKLENGLDPLMDKIFDLAPNPFILDINRKNVCE